MLEINNIEEYLTSINEERYMYTGTFDPPHLWHLGVIEKVSQLENWEHPLLINPCNRNKDKHSIISDLEIRKRWIRIMCVNIKQEIILVDDPRFRDIPGSMDDIFRKYNSQLIKIVGMDRTVEEGIKTVQIQEARITWRSSTAIKRSIQEWRNNHLEHLPRELLEDILSSWHKFKI